MVSFPNRGLMPLNVTGKYRLCLCHAFIFALNLIFPGVRFSTVFVHSNYNCGMNLTVIASKEGGTACRLYRCVYLLFSCYNSASVKGLLT